MLYVLYVKIRDQWTFARTWLNEPKGRNIRVNVLSPGRWGW
jgi:hypothetical protein